MSVTLVTLGLFFHIQQRDPVLAERLGWLPVTSLGIYIIAFALGFGYVSSGISNVKFLRI